ncbi:hypothetical protein N0V95_005997 [Ascochyta clinopodiicola]|nr:hypothetical protein N0V95_005997 [Ascochyta clinopodiicola]
MRLSAEKAMNDLKEYMVQMRHDAVEEIKDGLRVCIDSCADHICEEYDVIDKQTRKPVELKGSILMEAISDSEWYQHGMIELLKRNEDDAFEQMTWILEPRKAAPTDDTTTGLPRNAMLPACLPVGRDQYIQGIEQLNKATLAQHEILHKAFQCLQMIPDVVNYETAAHEAHDIAMLKQFMHTRWVAEMRKAHHMYALLMRGRGRGMGDQVTGVLQQMADMELD